MIDIFLVAALAAQANLPAPAAETVEVEISADAIVKVPAQGYRVIAFLGLPGHLGKDPKPADFANLKDRLHALEMPPRETCSPPYPVGFIGNEKYDDDELGDAGAIPATPASDNGPLPAAPEPYSGMFSNKQNAEQAAKLLRIQGHADATITPLLFDCADATKQAQLQALVNARQQIQPIADALGMHVRGFTRAEFGSGETSVAFALATMTAGITRKSDEVEVPANAKVQFALGK